MEQDSRNFHDQALETHRDKSDFLANMRHELRTPVNAIIGYSEMLLEDAKDTDQKDFIFDLQNIHKAGKQVLSLINQILDSSKIEASKADIDLESFRVSIHYELRTPLNIIIGYSEMLLEDAKKIGQKDFISDLHKIYKAGKNLLDLIKEILKGSKFEDVTVARDTKTSARSTAIQDMPHIIHSHKEDNANTMESRKAFLLVVDDNEMNRDMLSRRLKRQGYRAAVAEDGYQALKMIKAQQFDLVLLDIMMPGVNGLEVLCDLRKSHAMADLPIIMSSSKDRDKDIVDALQFGANDYVMKPIVFSVALARIKTQLSLKWAKEEIQGLAEQLEVRNSFIRKTFGRYLTNEIVDSLLESPKGLEMGGDRRKVTMLMSDLRGFTPLSERLTPEQVITILNRYLETMTDVIVKYQGTIDAFIGDAILVLFGAPVWNENDSQRAVACAVAMQLAMVSVNEGNRREGYPEIGMGIGVNTGEVVVGNIGSEKHAKYSVVGRHINLTSRIESYTTSGQILISDTTLKDTGTILKISSQMKVEPKGAESLITIYDVKGIGGEYNLSLPDEKEALVTLHQAIHLKCIVLEEKHISGAFFEGSLVKLSIDGGELYSEHPLALLSNIKMNISGTNGEAIPGDIYAKIVGNSTDSDNSFYLRFTAIPPKAAAFFYGLLDQR